MHIPLIDMDAQCARVDACVQQAMRVVCAHRQFLGGLELAELEQKLGEYAGVRHCICCASGTDALLMSLMAHDVGPGDAVFTSPFTFIASAEVIALTGATPVFVDINPRTFNLDVQQLKDAIARIHKQGALRVRGVIPVDLFGLPAEYDEINSLTAAHDMFVLADSAQSFGAQYRGRNSGSFARINATSFYPTKPLSAYGDGGAVFCDDDALASVLRSIRVHGQGQDKYNSVRLGLTARMDTLQAAVLLCKLTVFDDELQHRRDIARQYNEALVGLVQTPFVPTHCQSAWAHYSILCDERERLSNTREALSDALTAAGIGNAVYYRTCLHQMKPFAHLHHQPLPNAEDCARRILSLPMHPYMTPNMVARVVDAVRATVGG